ncbi:MAG: 4Fe-4S dicluster domain-containing protein [Bacteroides sp.]
MILNEAQLIYFSPTHTSERIGEAIVRGTGIRDVFTRNLTREEGEETVIPASALAIIVVPVYGGHVAPLAMQRLKKIRGMHTPVVLVVVYGNRAYEKALVDLDAFATQQDLKVIGGATFIGEHSYSSASKPIAVGRPNATDLQLAANFGKQIQAKISAASSLESLYPVDVSRISRPSQPLFPMLRFLRSAISLRNSGMPLPRTPWVEEESRCSHCGICVELCPAQAIMSGDELHTDATKCIKCCACVKNCPQQARVFDTPYADLLSQNFSRQKEPKTLL